MYTKTTFADGDTLYASNMNQIDTQVQKNDIANYAQSSILNGIYEEGTRTVNLFDMRYLMDAGWTKVADANDDIYTGSWTSLENRFNDGMVYRNEMTGSYPIKTVQGASYYRFYMDFKCDTVPAEVSIIFVFADGSTQIMYVVPNEADTYKSISVDLDNVFATHGGLVGMYFSHSVNTSTYVWTIKNARLFNSITDQGYSDNGYNYTAIDYYARNLAGDMKLLETVEVDEAIQTVTIPVDKTRRKMTLVYELAAATQTTGLLIRFADSSNHYFDVYDTGLGTSKRYGSISVDLDRIGFPEMHFFTNSASSVSNIAGYPGFPSIDFSGISAVSIKAYNGDSLVPAGSSIKVYVSKWE